MRKFFFPPQTIPFAFLLLCIAAYGLLIPKLGFYWDDWPYTWFAHTLGPLGLVKALAHDRPFLAGIYMTTTALIGPHPLAWQIFAIITRWFSVLSLWWTLRMVWPRFPRQAAWVALLFTVYPGFQQHWISVIYGQAYLMLAATLLSLGLMVYSIRTPRRKLYWPLTLAAMLLSAFSLFSTEYFAGVELARPLLLWFALQNDQPNSRKRIRAVLLAWLPYLAELVFFGVWRTFLFHAETYQVQALSDLESSPLNTLLDLLTAMFSDSFIAGLQAWGQVFNFSDFLKDNARTAQYYWWIAAASLVVLVVYLWKVRYQKPTEDTEPEARSSIWSVQAIITGALVLFASMLPFWIAGLPFNLSFPYDRFSLAMMVGSALLIAGLIEFFIRTNGQKIALLSVLIALSIGFQFKTANTFRRDYDNMRSFFWQLSWRVPDLKPRTALLAYELPFVYYSDYSLSAPLNWMYNPDNHTQQMPYILLYLRSRSEGTIPNLKPDLPIEFDFRALTFKGNTSQTLAIQYSPPSCLRILDPVYANQNSVPNLHDLLKKAIPITQPDQAITTHNGETADLPAELFGTANTNSWCYYFEKAELARQTGDWAQMIELYRESAKRKISTKNLSEVMIFIEPYARTGDWAKAQSLTSVIVKAHQDLNPALCEIWGRLKQEANPGSATREQQMIQEIQTELKCSKP